MFKQSFRVHSIIWDYNLKILGKISPGFGPQCSISDKRNVFWEYSLGVIWCRVTEFSNRFHVFWFQCCESLLVNLTVKSQCDHFLNTKKVHWALCDITSARELLRLFDRCYYCVRNNDGWVDNGTKQMWKRLEEILAISASSLVSLKVSVSLYLFDWS